MENLIVSIELIKGARGKRAIGKEGGRGGGNSRRQVGLPCPAKPIARAVVEASASCAYLERQGETQHRGKQAAKAHFYLDLCL